MPLKILIIDDDQKLTKLLIECFQRFGAAMVSASTPAEGLAKIDHEKPDAVILDVMMPGQDGFSVCREIRKVSSVPILMLTARGEVTDRIVGLELGADDYVSKPVDPRELFARTQAVLRRARSAPAQALMEFGALKIDNERREAFLDGRDLHLSSMEFEILVLFARHPNKVLSRDAILDHLRGIEWESFNRSIDVLVSRLRAKLGDDAKQPRFFKTVWGTGYLFLGDMRALPKAG